MPLLRQALISYTVRHSDHGLAAHLLIHCPSPLHWLMQIPSSLAQSPIHWPISVASLASVLFSVKKTVPNKIRANVLKKIIFFIIYLQIGWSFLPRPNLFRAWRLMEISKYNGKFNDNCVLYGFRWNVFISI